MRFATLCGIQVGSSNAAVDVTDMYMFLYMCRKLQMNMMMKLLERHSVTSDKDTQDVNRSENRQWAKRRSDMN